MLLPKSKKEWETRLERGKGRRKAGRAVLFGSRC